MNVDDSTPSARTVPSQSTVITPPNPPGTVTDLRSKDQLLAALQAEVRMLRNRVDALEAERRRFKQRTTTDNIGTEGSADETTKGGTPMWRTKNGKQTGWQPARR